MDYLQWAFVGSKHRRMVMEAWENELQKKKRTIFDGLLLVASIEEWR